MTPQAALLAAGRAATSAIEVEIASVATAVPEHVTGQQEIAEKDGPDAAYAEISNKSGKFVDRDLYVVVYRLDGHVLAHGANDKLIGTDQSNAKDVDGKAFVKERIELAHKQPTFWQEYKFKNPVTQQTERKQTYCERYEDTAVCAGVYSF
jgi:cytochrome c